MNRLLNYDPDLILGYVEGELSEDDRVRFEQMCKADAKLDELVKALMADRQDLRDLPDVEAPAEVMERVNTLLERSMLLESPAEEQTGGAPDSYKFPISRWMTYAAVAAMLIVTTGVVIHLFNLSGEIDVPDVADRTGEVDSSARGGDPGRTALHADEGRDAEMLGSQGDPMAMEPDSALGSKGQGESLGREGERAKRPDTDQLAMTLPAAEQQWLASALRNIHDATEQQIGQGAEQAELRLAVAEPRQAAAALAGWSMASGIDGLTLVASSVREQPEALSLLGRQEAKRDRANESTPGTAGPASADIAARRAPGGEAGRSSGVAPGNEVSGDASAEPGDGEADSEVAPDDTAMPGARNTESRGRHDGGGEAYDAYQEDEAGGSLDKMKKDGREARHLADEISDQADTDAKAFAFGQQFQSDEPVEVVVCIPADQVDAFMQRLRTDMKAKQQAGQTKMAYQSSHLGSMPERDIAPAGSEPKSRTADAQPATPAQPDSPAKEPTATLKKEDRLDENVRRKLNGGDSARSMERAQREGESQETGEAGVESSLRPVASPPSDDGSDADASTPAAQGPRSEEAPGETAGGGGTAGEDSSAVDAGGATADRSRQGAMGGEAAGKAPADDPEESEASPAANAAQPPAAARKDANGQSTDPEKREAEPETPSRSRSDRQPLSEAGETERKKEEAADTEKLAEQAERAVRYLRQRFGNALEDDAPAAPAEAEPPAKPQMVKLRIVLYPAMPAQGEPASSAPSAPTASDQPSP